MEQGQPGVAAVGGGEPDFWQQQALQQGLAGNGLPQNTPMLVAVRARPLSRDEAERGEFNIVKVLESRVVVVLDPHEYDQNLQPNRSKEKKYAFDYVFDEEASQAEIFRGTTRGLINGVLNGYNASVFAYGATGAGKTYTMLGALDSPGVMVLTLNDLYRSMRDDAQYAEFDFKVRLSYLEIYNEVIKDLLNPTDSCIGLPLNEDPVRGMVVAGITEYDATSASEILQLLHHGNMARAQEPTAANKTSSRSHAILQVTVEQSERTAHMVGQVKCGKLSLIDLAGSERASKTENTGLRLKEGANINRSLLALGNCINALADGRSHVPYRDSKMTRLLKDSLGGNCRTVMIANISPASTQFEETLNSLKYANRAKNLKTKVSSNIATVAAHIGDYQRIILALRSEVAQLKATVAFQQQQQLGAPAAPIAGLAADAQQRERERALLAEQAEAGQRQQARALETAIVQVCAERRQLAQQLDSLHGSLINQAAAAAQQQQQQQAGGAEGAGGTAEVDPALGAAAASVASRLAHNEQLALRLLQAIPERVANAERAAALRTLFHAHFVDIARAHAAYEVTVRQSYEDAIASVQPLPPRVQRAVGRLQEWQRLRAGTQPHRDFDLRMARLELPPLGPPAAVAVAHALGFANGHADGALGGAGAEERRAGGADGAGEGRRGSWAKVPALISQAQQPAPRAVPQPLPSPRSRLGALPLSGRSSPRVGGGAGGGAQPQPSGSGVGSGRGRASGGGRSPGRQPRRPIAQPAAARRGQASGQQSTSSSRTGSPPPRRAALLLHGAAEGGAGGGAGRNSSGPQQLPSTLLQAQQAQQGGASALARGASPAARAPQQLRPPAHGKQCANHSGAAAAAAGGSGGASGGGARASGGGSPGWPDAAQDDLSDEGTHLAMASHVDASGSGDPRKFAQPAPPPPAPEQLLPGIGGGGLAVRRRGPSDALRKANSQSNPHNPNSVVRPSQLPARRLLNDNAPSSGAARRSLAGAGGSGGMAVVAVSASSMVSGLRQPQPVARPPGSGGSNSSGYARAHPAGGRIVGGGGASSLSPPQPSYAANPSRSSLNAGARPLPTNPTGAGQSAAARRLALSYAPSGPKGGSRPAHYGGPMRGGTNIPMIVSR